MPDRCIRRKSFSTAPSSHSRCQTSDAHSATPYLSRALQATLACVVGVALAFLGFYVTGLLASQLDPQTLGISASTGFLFIAIAAWGQPAGVAWLASGSFLPKLPLGLAFLGAGLEVFVLVLSGLLPSAMHMGVAELRPVAVTLFWPAAFITFFSSAGAILGFRARQAFLLRGSCGWP